jgi:TRAP-type C4-dicarboxylate transport system substrate-binding protein
MRTTLVALAVAACALATHSSARADEPFTLRFAMTAPAASPNWIQGWEPWTQQLEKDSGGTLKVQTHFGDALADMSNVYDRTVNGAADLGYGVTGALRATLPGSSVVDLPLEVTGKAGSAAFWALYKYGQIAQEWANVRPLALLVYPQSTLHFIKPIKVMEDIRGLKIGAGGKVAADIVRKLGATPIATTPADMYESLQRQVIDAQAMPWTGVTQYKLHEVTNFHLNAALGGAGGFLILNKDVYAKLPEAAKAAIDKNSGEALSTSFGELQDKQAAEQFEAVKAMPGHAMADLTASEMVRWAKAITPVIDEWVKATPNGEAILSAYRADVNRLQR